MRPTKLSTLALAATLAAVPLAACGSSSGTGSAAHPTLTYWATNQGTSLQNDRQVLGPQIAKFTKQTGIKVNFEVIPWTTVLNQITAATVSGKGPDVLNIGNTWSASLQATGAFLPFTSSVMNQIGGSSRFLAGSLSATGAAGKPPVAVPLYSTAYGLYYNKAEFAAAGISGPPATWTDFVTDAKKLTKAGHYGLTLEAGQIPENVHLAFELSQQQGGSFFDASGKPTFDTPQNVAAVKQMIDFMQADKIANPSDAQYSKGTEALTDYATGKAAMVFWQTASGSLAKLGMKASDIGVAPLPLPSPVPAGGKKVTSMVAGINLAIFKDSKNVSAAEKFVKFMTSTPEQESLNHTYGSLPTVQAAYTDPAFNTPAVNTFRTILSTTAAPMPAVAAESQFETAVGTAIIHLYASAATGKTVTAAAIGSALSQAQQQLGG
ncbi:MAG: multiple sugar transport system substrate-binding protein [Streptosporangiaceae bacterium]|nr:multiple sugar transport system substrate-binding protein [Streptosporangiaceae bacterium]